MYLVTGGCGFIGSHIVERLVHMGQKPRVLDNLSYGKLEHLRGFEERVEFVPGNILHPDILEKVMKGVEVVFHQAALRSVPFSVDDPSLVNRVNVEGTVNVLLAARDAGVRCVLYASSSSVYGNGRNLPKRENQLPEPASPYAVSKLAGEYYCKVFSRLYGMKTVSLRYFNVFGPRQDPDSAYAAVIPRFIRQSFLGEPLEVHGDGMQSRDFTYIDNVVDANLLAVLSDRANGRVFNVGQGRACKIMDLIDSLRCVPAREIQWVHTAARPGDVQHSLADISQAAAVLGYRPQVSFDQGLGKTVEYFGQRLQSSGTEAHGASSLEHCATSVRSRAEASGL